MSLKTLKTTGLLTLAFLAVLSCKKEEETATNTTDNTSTSTPDTSTDDYVEFEE